MTKRQTLKNEKDKLYEEITKYCDWLCIARYLKNEAKNALKYFHAHKLSNIKKNLKEFSDYLMFLNSENCQKIENFTEWKERKRNLNNSISYFYNYENISDSDLSSIQNKIETKIPVCRIFANMCCWRHSSLQHSRWSPRFWKKR